MTNWKINLEELHDAFYEFEKYMDADKWDDLGESGVYYEDGLDAIFAFMDFIEFGCVGKRCDRCGCVTEDPITEPETYYTFCECCWDDLH